jgi:CRP-like cAMP-binding protein
MQWALLETLDLAEQQELLAVGRRRRFSRGEVIFHEGDPGDTLHLLHHGHVAVRVTTPMGEVATLRFLGPGDFFGEISVISSAPRNATVSAVDTVETLSLHRDRIHELRRRHPATDGLLLQAAVAEVGRLSHQLLDALYVSAPKRVLRRLLETADTFGRETQTSPVEIPITQDDLAGLAGTTRPTVNKVLADARKAGLLEVRRGCLIVVDAEGIARKSR